MLHPLPLSGARAAAAIALAGLACCEGAHAAMAFSDATLAAGIDYLQHAPNPLGQCWLNSGFGCEPERQTGGAAVGDFDGDGLDDLVVTRMDAPAILFRNEGGGAFSDATAGAGLDDAPLRSNGALWADIDNDGDLDLAVTTVAGNRSYLYINDGAGLFAEEAGPRGVSLPLAGFPGNLTSYVGYSIGAGDFDGDGYLDLCYAFWRRGISRLFRNRGNTGPGYFEDVTASSGFGAGTALTFGFSPAFADLDRDGRLDLPFACDFLTSRLLWNGPPAYHGAPVFSDGTTASGVGTDENGMGSTFGDYDGDGDLDWFITSIHDPLETCENVQCNWGYSGNRLYRNEGNRSFTDVTDAAGVREGSWGWGASFFDGDNDGDLDLVMTNGSDYPFTADRMAQFLDDPMRLWENDGSGGMTEVSAAAGMTDTGTGKGLLTFDYDADGDLDVLAVNNGGHPVLYRNDAPATHDWLRVRFTGAARAFEGLNAFLTLTPAEGGPSQVREMGVSAHFLAQPERVAHFGLGPHNDAPLHELRIEWPRSGTVQTFNGVARNQVFEVVAPAAEVVDPPLIVHHSADTDADNRIGLSELLRVIQFYNSDGLHLDPASEDGYAPGPGPRDGLNHLADYNPTDWTIELSELLRIIQFFNSANGYARDPATEDGFAPAA